LAQAETLGKNAQGALVALGAAHGFDPTQVAPLSVLARAAQKRGDPTAERRWLEKLAGLSEHDASVSTRLLELLIEAGRYQRAVQVGQQAIYADLSSIDAHYFYGLALLRTGNRREGRFELESARLCSGTPAQKARVEAALAAH
jgi:tetratricopeptide (TPR) repeat protein